MKWNPVQAYLLLNQQIKIYWIHPCFAGPHIQTLINLLFVALNYENEDGTWIKKLIIYCVRMISQKENDSACFKS